MLDRGRKAWGRNGSLDELTEARSAIPSDDCVVDQGLLGERDWKSESRFLFLNGKRTKSGRFSLYFLLSN